MEYLHQKYILVLYIEQNRKYKYKRGRKLKSIDYFIQFLVLFFPSVNFGLVLVNNSSKEIEVLHTKSATYTDSIKYARKGEWFLISMINRFLKCLEAMRICIFFEIDYNIMQWLNNIWRWVFMTLGTTKLFPISMLLRVTSTYMEYSFIKFFV